MVEVAVIGAAGYAGIEAVRLVLGHPRLSLTMATSAADFGKPLTSVYPGLHGATELAFTKPGDFHSYAGSVPYWCELHAGPCRDLNLIARHVMGASMVVVQVDAAGMAVQGAPATCCVLPLAGRVVVSAAEASASLDAWDAVLLAAGEGARLSVDGAAGNTLVALVRIPT